jgi:CcmD family protein
MVDTYPDLFWSYTVVWGVLTVYIVFLGARLSAVERKLTDTDKECCGNREV